jgi:hypothetical protein
MSDNANRFSQWMADFRWAMNVMRARRERRRMLFSCRMRFDDALRPRTKDGATIAYPDAIYHIKVDDFAKSNGSASTRTNRIGPAMGEVIVCAGPPDCLLQGDEAVRNQVDGCSLCRRIVIHEDGTETEYKTKAS